MKLDSSDVLYDSSSVSSDSSGSQSSTIKHDFISTIVANNCKATRPTNLVSFDGLHSGVPTKTTPTLTPTTLRSIEQSFLELANESISHSREAGFVPPLVEPSQPTPAQTQNSVIHHNSSPVPHQQVPTHIPQSLLIEERNQQTLINNRSQQHTPQPQELLVKQQQPRRNMGGRRPTRTIGMSPEEEERRQVRRERNKMAAARCRKRRMDHTNALLEETNDLEQKKRCLEDEIAQLRQTRDELEFILENHRTVCRLHTSSPPDIKPVIKHNLHNEEYREIDCNNQENRPSRPNSLPVGFDNNNRPNSLPIFTEPKPRPNSLHFKIVENNGYNMKPVNEIAGVQITTPSSGIPFNFDSLMEGGTGLTPVSTPLVPSCSSQQRTNYTSSVVDLTSPDTNPPKLVSL